MSLCFLAWAFLLEIQQAWGEKVPQITRPQIARAVRELLPRRSYSLGDLQQWLENTQLRNERAKRSHTARRARKTTDPTLSPANPP